MSSDTASLGILVCLWAFIIHLDLTEIRNELKKLNKAVAVEGAPEADRDDAD